MTQTYDSVRPTSNTGQMLMMHTVKNRNHAGEFPVFSNAIKAVVGLALCAACTAHAAIYTWSTPTGNSWTSTSNWGSGIVPGASDVAEFNGDPTGTGAGSGVGPTFASPNNQTPFTGAFGSGSDQVVGAIVTTSAQANSIDIGNDSSSSVNGYMTLDGTTFSGPAGSIANTIISNDSALASTSGTLEFREDVHNADTLGTALFGLVLGNTANVIQSGSGSSSAVGDYTDIQVSIDQANAGSSITFLGGGTGSINGGVLELEGTDSFTGGITVGNSAGNQGGIVQIDHVYVLPTTGTMTVYNNGELLLNASGTYGGLTQTLVLNGGGTKNNSGALQTGGNNMGWQGMITLGSNSSIDISGGSANANFSGAITDGGFQLKKQGSGNMILTSASNNMAGSTLIGNGTLTVAAGSTMGTGTLTMGQTTTNNTALVLDNGAQSVVNLSSTFAATSGAQTQLITLNSTALTVTETGTTTYGFGAVQTLTSSITGNGSVILSGSSTGALTLTGVETYTGGTQISGGTLLVDGSLSGSVGTDATVNISGGTLAGSGSIGGLITTTGGTITTGSAAGAIGVLTLGNGLNMSGGGTYLWNLSDETDNSTGAAGTDFDQILLSGSLTLGGSSALTLGFTDSPNLGDAFWMSSHNWTIITGTAGSGNFGAITDASYTDGSFTTSDVAGVVTLTYTAVPEPAAWVFVCAGTVAAVVLRKRRCRRRLI